MAGELAVRIADALAERGQIVLGEDGGEVTPAGQALFAELGIDVPGLARGHRAFCRPCLDWSMRRPHIAGAVGAALAHRFLELGWLRRGTEPRLLAVSPEGWRRLGEHFAIAPPPA
jgi:hypothetical protein